MKKGKRRRQALRGALCAGLCATMIFGAMACGNTKEGEASNMGQDITNTPATAAAEPSVTDMVQPTSTPTPTAVPVDIYAGISKKGVKALVSVHDPSILAADGGYYIYGSHMTEAFSTDMKQWSYIGNGYSAENPMFLNLISDDCGAFAFAGRNGENSYSVWAPQVIYNEAMGKYLMYFCTSSTYIKSSLCVAMADTAEGPFEWYANLLHSGFTSETIEQTDVYDWVDQEYAATTYMKLNGEYDNSLWPNCIDPAVFTDENGTMWMVYGSWSGGIFLLEIDPLTGLVIHPETDEANSVDAYFGKRLLGGGHKSIEGPHIQYDADSGYYYLFVSYGGLDRTGGYQIRVFRSETADGTYVDMNGSYPTIGYNHSYYGLKLSGNYYLPSLVVGYMATGGQSSFEDADGKKYLCYHTRFDTKDEYHEPRVKQYFLNEEGWPVLAPYTTDGETISETGYTKEEVIGTYFFLNQGTKIDAVCYEPVLVELHTDGSISGDSVSGSWSMTEGTYYMKLTVGETTYSGVFLRQNDQTGVSVMTFSAVGANESIWGVKYER